MAHEALELFDSFVEIVDGIYGSNKKRVFKPRLAIIDFINEHTYLNEFNKFKESFEKIGYDVIICDIRQLRYRNGLLMDLEDNVVDVVYRRAVTVDVCRNYTEIELEFIGKHVPKTYTLKKIKEKTSSEVDYIVQEYQAPYTCINVEYNLNKLQEYREIVGLYLYDGLLKGFLSRASKHNIISNEYETYIQSTLYIEPR